MKSKLDCTCDNGRLEDKVDIITQKKFVIYCQECNWEDACQSENCGETDVGDDGYCYECEFERSIDRAEALYDAWKEGD